MSFLWQSVSPLRLRYLVTEHPIYEEALSLMNLHSLIEGGWRFEISMHKTFVGMCYHHTKIIAYSANFLNAPPSEITDTLLHEIAHALVGPHKGHGAEWKAMAVSIGAKGTRCAEGLPVDMQRAPANYMIGCDNCGWSRPRYRLRKELQNHICSTCGNRITITEVSK